MASKKISLSGIVAAVLTAGCSIMPYQNKSACEGVADYGKCVSAHAAYREAVTGIPAGPPMRKVGDRAAQKRPTALTPVIAGNQDKSYSHYRSALYKELGALIEQPNAPTVKNPRIARTLVLPYPAKGGGMPLYMPRYIYFFTDEPAWVMSADSKQIAAQRTPENIAQAAMPNIEQSPRHSTRLTARSPLNLPTNTASTETKSLPRLTTPPPVRAETLLAGLPASAVEKIIVEKGLPPPYMHTTVSMSGNTLRPYVPSGTLRKAAHSSSPLLMRYEDKFSAPAKVRVITSPENQQPLITDAHEASVFVSASLDTPQAANSPDRTTEKVIPPPQIGKRVPKSVPTKKSHTQSSRVRTTPRPTLRVAQTDSNERRIYAIKVSVAH